MAQDIKQTILDLLKPQQMVFVATSADNQPRVRPMTLIYHDKKLYFATGSWDKKAVQISQNPRLEICHLISGENCTGYYRASGKLETISDPAVRKDIFDNTAFLHYYWDKPEDEGYVLYEMIWEHVEYMQPGENTSTFITW